MQNTAKRKADKSYDEAKDSKAAKKKVSEQEDKIAHYKKRHREKSKNARKS
jgi:hypothetical protein